MLLRNLTRPLATLTALLVPLSVFPLTAHAGAPSLALPIACELRKTCFIQNYVDVDPSAGAQDYRCGSATYDGHKGTDFRLLSTRAARAGVAVLAAAAGVVKALRDGMPDRLLGSDKSSVAGRECGNGVVIDHGAGWQTQYCHMLEGSVRVRRGQSVRQGQRLGLVGYSGHTQFPHLHVTLRHRGKTVDPFTSLSPGVGTCGQTNGRSLWKPELRAALAYRPGEIIEVGFASGPVTTRQLEIGSATASRASAAGPALVFFVRMMNARRGDRFRLRLNGPAGEIASNVTKPLARNKAAYVAFAGRKRRGERWPAGVYQGTVDVIRSGEIVLSRQSRLTLR